MNAAVVLAKPKPAEKSEVEAPFESVVLSNAGKQIKIAMDL